MLLLLHHLLLLSDLLLQGHQRELRLLQRRGRGGRCMRHLWPRLGWRRRRGRAPFLLCMPRRLGLPLLL